MADHSDHASAAAAATGSVPSSESFSGETATTSPTSSASASSSPASTTAAAPLFVFPPLSATPASGGTSIFGTSASSATTTSTLGGTSASTSAFAAPFGSGGSSLFGGSGLFGAPGLSPPQARTRKVVVVGEGGTGKTAWITKLLGGEFPSSYVATVGVMVRPCTIEDYDLTFWDCAGQERFGGLYDGYYIAGEAAIFFVDVSSPVTLQAAERWYSSVTRVCGTSIPMVLVGAKCDITAEKRQVEATSLAQFAESRGIEWVEISAKEGLNVNRPLELLAAKLKP